MTIEVGKVYQCGHLLVKIVHWEQDVVMYIGLVCNDNGDGEIGYGSYVHTYHSNGAPGQGSVDLRHYLEELPKRDTITIGSDTYYKDEFEAATKHLTVVEKK